MDIKKELRSLLADFEKTVAGYSSAVKEFESSDYVLENERMKKEIGKITTRLEQLSEENAKIREENFNLKVSLNEQIMDEKLSILKLSQKKIAIYFSSAADRAVNRLRALEEKIRSDISGLEKKANDELDTDRESMLKEIGAVSEKLFGKIQEHRAAREKEEKAMAQSIKKGFEALEREPVDEATMQERMKRNRLELKIGLNWINKIGICLILVGVGYAARYGYVNWFTDIMRSITFFLLGALFLGAGEYLYQKGKDVFSKGLLGGGISILYASVFVSYFMYEIISLNIGLVLLVLVTLVAVVLSIRYDSQTIGGFALVGGFLPLATFIHDIMKGGAEFTDPVLYGLLGYLFVLNVLMLMISFRKRWNIIMYMSFVMCVSCMVYLVFEVQVYAVAIAYSVVTFAMYQAIILLYPFRYRLRLTRADVVMLALNTFISCAVIYLLFEDAGITWLRGVLALVFALIYIGLGQFVQKVMKQEKEILVLFFGTALTFAVLMVPFQFGIHWMTLGWLIEGVILTVVGYRQRMRYLEYAGWGITALCIATFYLFDFMRYTVDPDTVKFFKIKYLSVVAGMITVLAIYVRAIEKGEIARTSIAGRIITGFKYFTVVSVWLFVNITGLHYYDKLAGWLVAKNPEIILNAVFYRLLVVAVVHIALAYGLSKIRPIYDRVIQFFSVFLYAVAILICLGLDAFVPALQPEYAQNTALEYVALGILIAFNVLVLFAGREILLRIITRYKANLEIYPLTISVYLLGVVTAFVVVQFGLGDVNLVLSFVYLVMAISCIIYGFRRRYSYVRLFGLALTFIAMAKLFLFDLRFLDARGKIFAYFGFGVSLLLISFIYQKIKNIVDVPNAKIE